MGDKINLLIMLVLAAGVAGAIYYWLIASKSGEVRKIDPSSQERTRSGQSSRPTVAKTAQLSALRERLADAQTSPTGLRKVPSKTSEPEKAVERSWRPEDAGLAEAPMVEAAAPSIKAPAVQKMTAPPAAPVVAAKPIIEAFAVPELPAVAVPPPSVAVAVGTPVAASVHVPASAAESESPVAAPAPVVPVKPPEAAVRPESLIHILLVDDSKVVRVKTEKLLLNKGYSVTTAVDGIDALAKLETLKPSIIITDIEMPNLDGFGLVRNVRGNLRTAEIPVIVMTSHVNLHLDIAATEGINGFLPKPFNDQDLLDQVAFLCES